MGEKVAFWVLRALFGVKMANFWGYLVCDKRCRIGRWRLRYRGMQTGLLAASRSDPADRFAYSLRAEAISEIDLLARCEQK